ncbi:MAG: hypothetical protein KAT29_08440, partial [Anaerolineales bacterium]|nr:hypothetical protein [Anaerolineales bacterium]
SGVPGLSQIELEQLVADCALNNRSQHLIFEELSYAVSGTRRSTTYEIPFSMENGWSAVVFADDQSQMVHVIGLAEILEPHLAESYKLTPENKPDKGRFRHASGLMRRIGNIFQRPRKASRKVISMLIYGNQVELIQAYAPDSNLQYDHQGEPLIPEGLVPLGRIRLSEEIR